MSIGIPIKSLYEAQGHIVTCETITGDIYRGKLNEAEDNMNCLMAQVTATYRNGRVSFLENIYIRGSKILFFILPDMVQYFPLFKRQTKTGQAGRGKSFMLRAMTARGRDQGGPTTRRRGGAPRQTGPSGTAGGRSRV